MVFWCLMSSVRDRIGDTASITIPLPPHANQLLFMANVFDIGDKDMVATLDDDELAQEVTHYTIEVNDKEVFYTSRSHITQDMPYEFYTANITEQHSNLSMSLREFGEHLGFNITVYIMQGKVINTQRSQSAI